MSLTIDDLKKELDKESLSRVLNKYILGGDPICFPSNKNLIFALKENISTYFDIHPKMIEIVGSAKLGISLSEDRFGGRYNKNSDIDMAVVSIELFDMAWNELMKLDSQFYTLKDKDRQFLKDCSNDIPDGFISPDKLPEKCDFRKKWWKIFSDLSNKKEFEFRKIRGRLFKNWFFVEKYYSIQLKKIKRSR